MARKFLFRIFRFDSEKAENPYFQDYYYEEEKDKVVLEALMDIRNEQDATLAFRYSCREAVCGSCGLVINGEFELACRKRLNSLKTEIIVIEPLPNLPVLKDLVVDMEPFWQALEMIKPYVMAEEEAVEEEKEKSLWLSSPGYRIEEKEMEAIEPFTNCILCGCCYSACPVVARDERYLGPIALAKLYRYIRDPRDQRRFRDWEKIGTSAGLWGCDTVFRCNEVCPRQVNPAHGLLALRRRYLWEKIKQIFRKEK
ncbi:MAG: succinate dehydrogenase iron-sulfur subunit [Candidatus Aminicenantes bacterium]|nr:succinate dehydrogenase iron-sulfur subunit [Candidatus Aminicenantes bacterium]